MKCRFSRAVLDEIHRGKILGIRAGTRPHRFLGIWVVVVNERVFVRPWNDKPSGWRQTFLKETSGRIQLSSGREIGIRVKKVSSELLLNAIDAAYAEKYNTRASRKWVIGLVEPRRRETTTELLPA